MSTRSTTRASEVLDALVREPARRPMYRRSRSGGSRANEWPGQVTEDRQEAFASLAQSGSSASPSATRILQTQQFSERLPSRLASRLPQWMAPIDARKLAAGLAVIALVVLGLGWNSMRRPGSLDDRLPIASSASGAQASGGQASGATSQSDSGAAGGVSSASPTGVAPTQAASAASASGPVFVHVAGAVLSAGVVELPAGSRVVDAVAAAGGLRPDADSNRVNLAATLLDGSQVMVPAVGQSNPVQVPVLQGSGATESSPTSGSAPVAGAGPVDLNTATLEQLESLPGVGPATAQAILSFREKEGRFDSVESLLDVRGIGDAKFEALRELVTV